MSDEQETPVAVDATDPKASEAEGRVEQQAEGLQERRSTEPVEGAAASPEEDDLPEDGAGAGLWPVDRMRPLVEALLFASGDPLPVRRIAEIVEGATAEEVQATLADLATELLTRGIRLVEVAGGWQLRTAPEHQAYVRRLFREKPQRLSRAATETVAVVAYKQPVTRHEIEAVRGVDSGGVLESLVERRLVKVVGRRDVPGRPLVYATTREFLELFGLRSIRDLPTLPELGSDFERMSERGGFHERDHAPVLPLEEGDGAQDEAAGEEREGERSAEGDGRDEAGPEAAGGDEGGVEGDGFPGRGEEPRDLEDGGGREGGRDPEGEGDDEDVPAEAARDAGDRAPEPGFDEGDDEGR